MKILSKEATIKTATVQIHSLAVSGRQVTLSLFRQFHQESIIDVETGLLLGVPWGRVNYRFGECSDFGQQHLHVVWQKGEELRRACVDPSPGRERSETWSRLSSLEHQGHCLYVVGLLSLATTCRPVTRPNPDPGWYYPQIVAIGGRRWPEHVDAAASIVHHLWISLDAAAKTPDDAREQRSLDHYKRELDATIQGWIKNSGIVVSLDQLPDEAFALAEELKAEADQYRQQLDKRYEELSALDQLFIAT